MSPFTSFPPPLKRGSAILSALILPSALLCTGCGKNSEWDHSKEHEPKLAGRTLARESKINAQLTQFPDTLENGSSVRKFQAPHAKLLLINLKDLHFSDGAPNNAALAETVSAHSKEMFQVLNQTRSPLSFTHVILEDYLPSRIEELKKQRGEYLALKENAPLQAKQRLETAYQEHGGIGVHILMGVVEPLAGIEPGLWSMHQKVSRQIKNDYTKKGRLSPETLALFIDFNRQKETGISENIVRLSESESMTVIALVAGYAHSFRSLTNRGVSLIEICTPTCLQYVAELKKDPRYTNEMSGVD